MARIRTLEGELASYRGQSEFTRVALGMVVEKYAPGETLGQWLKILRLGFWPGPTYPVREYHVDEARNIITQRFLEDPAAKDVRAFYWTDSDMVPDSGLMTRLNELTRHPRFLAPDGGVIVGSYYLRAYPFEVQLWEHHPEVREAFRYLPPHRWVPLLTEGKKRYLEGRPGQLFPIGGGGTGNMLIRRDVLERMTELKGASKVWQIRPLSQALIEALKKRNEYDGRESWTEDLWFCMEVHRMLGIKVLADADLRLSAGHVMQQIVSHDHYLAAHTVPENVTLDTSRLPRGYAPQRADVPT